MIHFHVLLRVCVGRGDGLVGVILGCILAIDDGDDDTYVKKCGFVLFRFFPF